jgi:hypothetical protein
MCQPFTTLSVVSTLLRHLKAYIEIEQPRKQQSYRPVNTFLYALHLCYILPSFGDQSHRIAALTKPSTQVRHDPQVPQVTGRHYFPTRPLPLRSSLVLSSRGAKENEHRGTGCENARGGVERAHGMGCDHVKFLLPHGRTRARRHGAPFV